MRLVLILCAALASGCAAYRAPMNVVSPDGKVSTGEFQPMPPPGFLHVNADGRRYSGKVVVSDKTGSGMALLTSDQGGALRCDVVVNGLEAQGRCTNDGGRRFDIATK